MERLNVPVLDQQGEPSKYTEWQDSKACEVRYSVNEIFGVTLQGEGVLIGMPTHFVRLNACDYRCSWCDSLHSVLPELIKMPGNHTPMTAHEICANLLKRPKAGLVTISGGNPALHRRLNVLIDALKEVGFKVALETQGSILQEWFPTLNYLTISPKPPSSGMTTDWDILTVILNFSPNNANLKVVVFDDRDIEYAAYVHSRYPTIDFSVQCGTPQTKPAMPTTMEMMDQYDQLVQQLLRDARFADARILPQLHVWLWGHKRGV